MSTDLQGSYGWTDTLKSIEYGPGSLKTALPKLLQLLEGKRALVVTGRSLKEKVRGSHSHQQANRCELFLC